MLIEIEVNKKVATATDRNAIVVCGNSDYEIEFLFDSEWDAYAAKTARFIWNGQYVDGNVYSPSLVPTNWEKQLKE